MNRYYIEINPPVEHTAWYKSIADIEFFLSELGFNAIPIEICKHRLDGDFEDVLSLNPQEDTGIIFLQYPRVVFELLNLSKFINFL